MSDKLKEFLQDSYCSFEIDLLIWSRRFDYGVDNMNQCVEAVWLYVDFGPFCLKLAVAHWDV